MHSTTAAALNLFLIPVFIISVSRLADPFFALLFYGAGLFSASLRFTVSEANSFTFVSLL
jgi:hypothetical protein